MIKFPKVDTLYQRAWSFVDVADSDLTECASKGECGGLIKASEPKLRVSPTEVLSVGDEKVVMKLLLLQKLQEGNARYLGLRIS